MASGSMSALGGIKAPSVRGGQPGPVGSTAGAVFLVRSYLTRLTVLQAKIHEPARWSHCAAKSPLSANRRRS